MAKTNSNIKSFKLLDQKFLDIPRIKLWNLIQESFKQQGLQIVEFEEEVKESGLTCFINNFEKVDRRKKRLTLNQVIAFYVHRDSDLKNHNLNELREQMGNIGLLVPINDIKRPKAAELSNILNVLGSMTRNFNFMKFFDKLHSWKIDQKSSYLEIDSLLYYIENYINSIVFEGGDVLVSLRNLGSWHEDIIDRQNFDKKLHTTQLFEYLLLSIDSWIVDSKSVFYKRIGEELSKEVKAFFNRFLPKIQLLIHEVSRSNAKKFLFLDIEDFHDSLYLIVKMDEEVIRVENIVEALQYEYKHLNSRYDYILSRFKSNYTFRSKWSELFSRRKVLDVIGSIVNATDKSDVFSFFNPSKSERIYSKSIFERLDKSEIETLVNFIINDLNEEQKIFIKNRIDTATKQYFHAFANNFTKLFFEWDINAPHGIPTMNIKDQYESNLAIHYLNKKKKQEKAEAKKLKAMIAKMEEVNSLSKLKIMSYETPKFVYASNQKKWDLALKDKIRNIEIQHRFRLRKMKELGFDMKIPEQTREAYLDEMIKIEYEIRPFIPFVTRAFLSALPSRKIVEFDPYRHQSDGIEFDPETINDPDKWIRGDVMKTLKHRIVKGEITQVNSFCLDLSGSMDNNRMRNLYKVIYLLVMALEGRKSYDSFHFFSNTFIPGVEYTKKYTHKKLLFQILLKVSKVVGSKLVLYGGLEGTNISDGIKGCLISMDTFVEQLKHKNPGLNITKSMFVITDGEPSLGIRNKEKLNSFIQEKRERHELAIKGIYIKAHPDEKDIVSEIFGSENCVETVDFAEGVQKFVSIMTRTYKQQRLEFKWKQKREKLNQR